MGFSPAIVLELTVFVVLTCFLLLLLGQAADAVSFEQTIDAGAGRFGQRLLYQVYQIIEGQPFLPQRQDHRLFGLVKGVLDSKWAAAMVLGRGALLPAMNRAQRDGHLLGQSAAGFLAADHALPIMRSRCFLLVVALE
jgi:hypothetical protein